MAIDPKQLEGLDINQLQSSLIQYAETLDTANTTITQLSSNVAAITNELEKLKTEKAEKAEKLSKAQKKELQEIEAMKKEYAELKEQHKTLENSGDKAEIETLKVIIKEKESEIEMLKSKNKEVKNNTSANGIVHSYSIKGFENRTGLEINGGTQYIKAIIIVKLLNNVLYWEVRSPDLDLNINRSLNLKDYKNEANLHERVRIVSLEARTNVVGSYTAIKEFLQIPDTVENGFNKQSLLMVGGGN